jgi:hypothetical protein
MIKKLACLLFLMFTSIGLSAAISYSPVTVTGGAATASVGAKFSYTISASSSYAITSYYAEDLPDWLSINTNTGVVSGTPSAVGTHKITIGASSSRGTGAATLTITVAKGSQTISCTNLPTSIIYGNGPYSYSATASSGLTVSISVSGPATLSGGTLTITGAGTVVVTASQSGNDNYNAASSVTQTIAVAKASQTITFSTTLTSVTYGDGPFDLSATATSGLDVSISVSGPATLSGGKLTITGAGTVVVTASQSGNGNYNAATTITQTITVSKATASIAIVAENAAYDGNQKSATVTVLPKGLAVTVLYNGEETAPSKLGYYTVTATIEDDNYSGTASASMLIGYKLSAWGVNGSVSTSTSGSILAAGTSVTLKAKADTTGDYTFARWVGDVPSGEEATNPLTITMDHSTTLVANCIEDANAPTAIKLDPQYFVDSDVSGTVVGKLTTTDADVGDTFTYALVEGACDFSNDRFTVVGDELVTNDTFDFSTDRTISVRISSTDAAGNSVESIMPITLIDATPEAQFEFKSPYPSTSAPYVNFVFRLADTQSEAPYPNGRGINYPTEYLKRNMDLFTISENDYKLSLIEGSPYVGKIDEVSSTIKTVLLIDNSASMGGALSEVREAAKLMISQMISTQEMAIYTFSDSLTKVQDFTSDKTVLSAALDTITVGSATTNLNGAIYSALDLWTDSFSMDEIEAGFMVVLTDGLDQAGIVDADTVVAKRDANDKRVTMVGIAINGNELDSDSLAELASAGYWSSSVDTDVENDDLKETLADVQASIVEEANSYYWLSYISPKRGSSGTVTISLDDYYSASYTFDSSAFADVDREVVVDPSFSAPEGVSTLSVDADGSLEIEANTHYALDSSVYEWVSSDPRLLSVTDLSTDGSQSYVSLDAHVASGTVTLTVSDTASIALTEDTGISSTAFEKTVTVVIGSGVDADSGNPWATATDWANGWSESSWFGWMYDGYAPWVWSVDNGWFWCDFGDEIDGVYLYDVSLKAWVWTSEDFYPWAYVFGSVNKWVWIQSDGKPGIRIFYVDGLGWLTESAIINGAASE